MFLCSAKRDFFYKVCSLYYSSLGFKPTIAEVGVLRGDNAEKLGVMNYEHLYLVDAWDKSGVEDYVRLNKEREWTRSIDSLAGYFGGPLDSQLTFDSLYQSVRNRFKGINSISIVRSKTSEIPNLIHKNILPSSMDYIYIDAGHQYETVLDDLIVASEWLSEDGLLQCNDVIYGESGLRQNLGVQDALTKFLRFSNFRPLAITASEGGDLLLARGEGFSKFLKFFSEVVIVNKIALIQVPQEFLSLAHWSPLGLSFVASDRQIGNKRSFFSSVRLG